AAGRVRGRVLPDARSFDARSRARAWRRHDHAPRVQTGPTRETVPPHPPPERTSVRHTAAPNRAVQATTRCEPPTTTAQCWSSRGPAHSSAPEPVLRGG